MDEIHVGSERVKVRGDDDDDHLIATVGMKDVEIIKTPKMTVIVNRKVKSKKLIDDLLTLIAKLGR